MPAAAVIPSLTAFSYVVAVETLVAVGSAACHCEEIGALTAGTAAQASAGRQARATGTGQRAPRGRRYSPGTGEIG